MNPKTITAAVIGVIVLFVLGVAAAAGVKTVQTGEIGVVYDFGVAKSTIEPGLHFLNPISQRLGRYDTKTREVSFEFQAYSKDAQTVSGQLSVQYIIQPDKVLNIAREFGSISALEERLNAITQERAKSVFADKGAMILVESRAVLSGEIEQRIMAVVSQYYVTIKMVALSDISFNDAFESAVEQKMVSEQEKLRAEYEKERAIIKSEELLEVAKREAEASIEKANGDAKSLQIMQQAWSSLSAEVKDAMLRQTFYEKWDGVLPQVMSGENMSLIVGDGYTGGKQIAPAAITE